MTLPLLVTKEMWQEFDDAWAELRSSGGPIDELLPALKLAGEKKRAGRLVGQAREHAEALIGADRAADAAIVLGASLAAGGNPGELAVPLWDACEKAWSDEAWYPVFKEATGFAEADWTSGSDEHLIQYLRPLGAGAVLYNTLGHCRGHRDMEPLTHYYPKVERCSWEKPQYYELLRRAIRWGLGQTA